MFRIQQVSDHDVFFGAEKWEDLVPEMEQIPEIFTKQSKRNKWNRMVDEWFSQGIQIKKIEMQKSIADYKFDSFRHLKAVLSCWRIEEEQRKIYVAFLLSEWCQHIEYEIVK